MGEYHGERLEIHRGLATKAAANFRGSDLDLAQIDTGDRRGVMAHREVALGAAPQLHPARGVSTRHTSVGLDIALVAHGHRIGLLNHHLGFFKRRVRVAHSEADVGREIRGLLGVAIGESIVMQNRCVGRQRLVHVSDSREHVVHHLHRLRGFGGELGRGRGHRGHRLRVEQHFAL